MFAPRKGPSKEMISLKFMNKLKPLKGAIKKKIKDHLKGIIVGLVIQAPCKKFNCINK